MPYRNGRSNIKGTTASRKSFKRMPYAYDEKKRALEAHSDGWTLADIGTKILGGKPARAVSQLLFKWRKKVELIDKMVKNVRTQKFERFRERAIALALSQNAETAIVDWINSLRSDGIPVSSTMLRLKALEIFKTRQALKFTAIRKHGGMQA
ncbi:hypothetical protein P43SY_000859 [Pythium insidiosum]|uniref:HTH CENPB-type domain-containing protein n=1 Tax=Pythium insidiosum TaxID=114742 RepID=A0AAD5M0X3_PYTIN|nr:hypothetical protein P43SY_000859 [Pythium insidiosum]